MIPVENRKYTQDERYRRIKKRVTDFNKKNTSDDFNTDTSKNLESQGEIKLDDINKDLVDLSSKYESIASIFLTIQQTIFEASRTGRQVNVSSFIRPLNQQNFEIDTKTNTLILKLKNSYKIISFSSKNQLLTTQTYIKNLVEISKYILGILDPIIEQLNRGLRVDDEILLYLVQLEKNLTKLNVELSKSNTLINNFLMKS